MKIINSIGKVLFRTLALFFLIAQTTVLLAQEKISIGANDYKNDSVEMADLFRQDGKIYVVVAVLLTIFWGLMFFLVLTDRKISKLEKLANIHSQENKND
jgi:hypothetical protein